MLELLIAARDEDGSALTMREIRNQMVTFIVAGHETVASALTWALALLAANPAVQRALQGEVDRAPLDWTALPYTRAVFD